jgi:hypothetical protein
MADRGSNWLERIGLGQYAEAFVENAIEWAHPSRWVGDVSDRPFSGTIG